MAACGVALWLLAGVGATALRGLERAEGILPAERTGGEAVAAALGGFRGLAADFLWLRALQMQEDGRYDEILLICRMILDLQPRFAGVWSFLAWNQAYNLAFEANTPAERWRWVRSGLDLLEKEGIVRNPHTYVLFWELGFAYFFRVSARSHDPAYRYYHEQLAPVPRWCRDAYEFVDAGLWSDAGVRYRLYRRRAEAGRVVLGAARAPGAYPTRSRKAHVVAVAPGSSLASARTDGPLEARDLVPGARLYRDAGDRVAAPAEHQVVMADPEPSVPAQLSDAALVPLSDAQKELDGEDYLTLELRRPAELWVGWFPDEVRNFHIARAWLSEAGKRADAPRMKIARLRVHALVEMGQWERAYGEFGELFRKRVPGDQVTFDAYRNFLVLAALDRQRRGDAAGARRWYDRLKAEFPSWEVPLEDMIKVINPAWGP
jgi:hypothetical protein